MIFFSSSIKHAQKELKGFLRLRILCYWLLNDSLVVNSFVKLSVQAQLNEGLETLVEWFTREMELSRQNSSTADLYEFLKFLI